MLPLLYLSMPHTRATILMFHFIFLNVSNRVTLNKILSHDWMQEVQKSVKSLRPRQWGPYTLEGLLWTSSSCTPLRDEAHRTRACGHPDYASGTWNPMNLFSNGLSLLSGPTHGLSSLWLNTRPMCTTLGSESGQAAAVCGVCSSWCESRVSILYSVGWSMGFGWENSIGRPPAGQGPPRWNGLMKSYTVKSPGPIPVPSQWLTLPFPKTTTVSNTS